MVEAGFPVEDQVAGSDGLLLRRAESNISYSENTTRRGKDELHKRFTCRDRKHLLLIVGAV